MIENHSLLFILCRDNFRNLQIILIAACSYLLLFFALYSTAPFASSIKFNLKLEHDGQVQVYYSNDIGKKNFSEKFSKKSKDIKAGVRQDVLINLPNVVLNALRVDLGSSEGTIKLYNMRVISPIVGKEHLGPTEIARLFKAGSNNVSLIEKEKYVLIKTEAKDSFIVSRSPILAVPTAIQYGIPALFSCLIMVGLYRFNFKGIESLLMSKKNVPSSGRNVQALDGLRGIGALMVVGDHCYGKFVGLGAGGVWIFLVLSGFLLAGPFISNPGLITSRTKMVKFYAHRFRRILPIYYTYIVVVFLLTGHFDLAVRHFLFLEGAGHLWVIPQEMAFYLLVPPLFFITGVVLRGRLGLGLLFTLCAVIAVNKLLTINVFSMYGMGNQRLRLYFGVFLSGVAAAYLFKIISGRQDVLKQKIVSLSSVCGFILMGYLLVASSAYPWGGTKVYAQMYFGWYGAIAALLVLCVALADGSRLQKILAWRPLCSLGVVSLSFYLVHPLVIGVLMKSTRYYLGISLLGIPLLIATIIVSYVVSCLLYKGIEEPFLRN